MKAKETCISNVNDLTLSVVLYNELPQYIISCFYVIYIPINHFSEKLCEIDNLSECYTAIYLGTEDGKILYHLYMQERLIRLFLLVPNNNSASIQSICIGKNRYGQYIVLAVDRNGGVSQWNAYNGLCIASDAQLLRDIAPIQEMRMLSNYQYALISSRESRMLVLDAWSMKVMFCKDTAQEQLRRNIATSEITYLSKPNTQSDEAILNCDSIVLSLGMEGLLKFYTWTKPNDPRKEGVLYWKQESSWILSWADDAIDITCSQSTSLTDGDELNPQIALMRSIRSSYFPISAHISPNGTLLLFIWKTKWAVLQTHWLRNSHSDPPKIPNSCGIVHHSPNALSPPFSTALYWESGKFLSNDAILMQTSSNDTILFRISCKSDQSNGNCFIFTKAKNQIVLRSQCMELPSFEQYSLVSKAESRVYRVPSLKINLSPQIPQFLALQTENRGEFHVFELGNRDFLQRYTISHTKSRVCEAKIKIMEQFQGTTSQYSVSVSHILLFRDSCGISLAPSDRYSSHTKPEATITNIDLDTLALHDIPIFIRGYSDGRLSIGLLTQARDKDTFVSLQSSSAITSLAHLSLYSVQDAAFLHFQPSNSISGLVFSGSKSGQLHIIYVYLEYSSISLNISLTASCIQQFQQNQHPIERIAFSPFHSSNLTRFLASIGSLNRRIVLYKHCQNPKSLLFECVGELNENNDAIVALHWRLERSLLYVECEDARMQIWNLETGILERSVPIALLHGRNAYKSSQMSIETVKKSVQYSQSNFGSANVHVFHFHVQMCANQIKRAWKQRQKRDKEASDVYALRSIEFLIFSLLLSWKTTPEIDASCKKLLGIEPMDGIYSCAFLNAPYNALTVALPQRQDSSRFIEKWQVSAAFSAHLALGIVSLCMNLMDYRISASDTPFSPRCKDEMSLLWSQLITQHSVVLPEAIQSFQEPSLEILARYGFQSCDYTPLVARILLHGVIQRLSDVKRSIHTAEYAAKLYIQAQRLEIDHAIQFASVSACEITVSLISHIVHDLGAIIVLLSMIGTCFPGEISPATARQVCDILVFFMQSPILTIAIVAIELLTKGLMLFRPHLVDLSSLISQLLRIDVRVRKSASNPRYLSHSMRLGERHRGAAALSLLLELGACEANFVLSFLQQQVNILEYSDAYRESILLYLIELINLQFLLLFRHLPAVMDILMSCLDPVRAERRKKCLDLCTLALYNLVERFSMVAFHKETQRVAFGTIEATIIVYDLKTCTKWRVFHGHSNAISALCFRVDGQVLASYAAREASVRWWNCGQASLLESMLKLQQMCLKEHVLPAIQTHTTALSSNAELMKSLQCCRLEFFEKTKESERYWQLTREDTSQIQFLLENT